MSDELHASYSKNLANQSVQKGLLKFAKDRGLSNPEIWQHNGEWAMRYTGSDGEVHQLSLGGVFSRARSVIASLSAKKPKVALTQPDDLDGEDLGDDVAKLIAAVGGQNSWPKNQVDAWRSTIKYAKAVGTAVDNGDAKVAIARLEYVLEDAAPVPEKVAKLKPIVQALIKRLRLHLSLAQRNSTEDSKGRPINEGDKVQISKSYGGGTTVVKSVNNGFVQLSNGKSYSSSDVTVIRAAGMSLAMPSEAARLLKEFKAKKPKGTVQELERFLDSKRVSPAIGLLVIQNYRGSALSLSASAGPLTRLNALSLSEVTYRGGWFLRNGKRLGKTESEAMENL